MKTLVQRIKHLNPCPEAINWLKGFQSPQKAWDACPRGDWLLWLIGNTITSEPWSDDRKPLLACALDCADTVRHLRPKTSAKKIADAIGVLRKWIAGKAEKKAASMAQDDLYDAVAAAYATATATTTEATAAATAATATATIAAAAAAAAYATAAAAAIEATEAAAAAVEATEATEATATATIAAAAYADARIKSQKQTADIVRQHFPKPPKISQR